MRGHLSLSFLVLRTGMPNAALHKHQVEWVINSQIEGVYNVSRIEMVQGCVFDSEK
jgi:hypothetical protein